MRSITQNTRKAIKPIHNIQRQSKIGAEILPKYLAAGTVIDKAKAVPKRAVAISKPIANAISFPLNHRTIILDTVIPAVSTPTPKIAYPRAATITCAFHPKSSPSIVNASEMA